MQAPACLLIRVAFKLKEGLPIAVAGSGDDDESGLWQYKDPSGRTIGDYTAAKLLAWATKGFFPGGLEVSVIASTSPIKNCSCKMHSTPAVALHTSIQSSAACIVYNFEGLGM